MQSRTTLLVRFIQICQLEFKGYICSDDQNNGQLGMCLAVSWFENDQ